MSVSEMTGPKAVLRSDSFPPIDAGIGWALTIICFLIALLLTLGILQVQIGPMSGAALLGIAGAQFAMAFAVAAVSRRTRRGQPNPDEARAAEPSAPPPSE